MASWKRILTNMVVDAEEQFDLLKYRLRERLGGRNPIMIVPYRGFGTPQKFYLRGRVLEDRGISPPTDNDSVWNNLLNMYRRFESDEIPYARVRARMGSIEQEAQTDVEGFFTLELEITEPLPSDQLWHTVELELVHPIREGAEPAKAEAQVLVPPEHVQFGVISDIDDTVLQTNAAHLIKMARTVFLGNARTRLPFHGVAAFYRALLHGGGMAGTEAAEVNPLFYVSSSPWNIYDLLTDFFHLQDIPLGPIMFLRDWGISREGLLPTKHASHKLEAINTIMDFYPHLKFILIGDSGQEDPEIYAETIALHPDRVLAIYIRNVSRSLKRPKAVRELAKKVAEEGVTLILAEDTIPMAEHAVEKGWIGAYELPAIRAEKEADEAPPSPVEKLLGEEEPAPTVLVDGEDQEATQEAVEEGAIEEALEVGDDERTETPTVIVDEDKDKKE
jgi:phosphatidate phosphatase APP1